MNQPSENRGIGSVIQGDCLEVMRSLPDNSVDLIATDPPYFKVKGKKRDADGNDFEWWDKQWDKPARFLEWLDCIAAEWARVLKPNGSLYCFASPKMAARVEVRLGERLNVLNHVVWLKPEAEYVPPYCGKDAMRSWTPYSERIIFCEHYGADNIAKGEAGYGAKCDELRGFVFEPLRAYLDGERIRAQIKLSSINALFGFATTGSGWARDTFTRVDGGWNMITPDNYTKLQQAFPGYFTREYEDLRREYEDLRREYEDLRRPFSVTADVPYTDVWTFPTVQAYKGKHPCEKPAAMLEHIISTSSRPGAVVLDCFAGSGSTLVAAKKLGRSYIGIEIDPHWASVCRQRLGDFTTAQPTLEERVAWLKTQVAAQGRKIKRIEDSGQLNLFNQSS